MSMIASDVLDKAVGNTNAAQLLTQPGGIFAIPGADRNLVSTFVTPTGLGNYLPVFAATDDDPRYGFWTGVGAESGPEADYPCDDGPTSLHTGGYLTASWGRIVRSTPTIELTALLHTKRGVQTDLNIYGNLLADHPFVTRGGMVTPSAIDLVTAMEMIKVGIGFERKLSRMLWNGSVANNSAHGGYKEFVGLDTQIGTGKVDVDTSTAMAAADSLVMDFQYSPYVDGSNDLLDYIVSMAEYLEDLAERTRMGPVTWAIVMRRELWHYVIGMWPCKYFAGGCGTGGVAVNFNDSFALEQREAMRRGMYLPIQGKNWKVILDDGLPQFTNSDNGSIPVGSAASGVRFIPLTVLGRIPVTYWEYIDYRQISRQLAPLGLSMSDIDLWTDGGTLLWAVEKIKTCIKITGVIEPRVILRTPQLAGRLDAIVYPAMTVPLRGAYPTDASWKQGGVSSR